MPELHLADAALLAAAQDPATGVEYIPTGLSPYALTFRRLVHRLALAGQRANDLRVYADGDCTVGVRPGQCSIADAVLDFHGVTDVSLPGDAITHLWLDASGAVQSGETWPTDATGFIPLATVTTQAGLITTLRDERGGTFLLRPCLGTLGVNVDAATINAALDDAGVTVTAAALNRLTAGGDSDADGDHRHRVMRHDTPGVATFTLRNDSADPAADAALAFRLTNRLDEDLLLSPDADTGFLTQRYGEARYHCIGVTAVQWWHEGALLGSVNDALAGMVTTAGEVVVVVLSVGENMQSSVAGDGISVSVNVNGSPLTATLAALTSAAGAGFRSTAQGHGQAATIVTSGAQHVQRGDLLTLDLTRNATGTISVEATQIAIAVIVRAAGPE